MSSAAKDASASRNNFDTLESFVVMNNLVDGPSKLVILKSEA